MDKKVCSQCGRELPFWFYNKSRDKKDGLRSECRFCYVSKRYNQSPKESEVKPFRKCKMCQKTFAITSFPKDENSYDGISYFCKDCHKTYNSARVIKKSSTEEPIVFEKKCQKCGRILPSSSFSKDHTRPDGLNARCKDCMREYKLKRKKEKQEKLLLDKGLEHIITCSYEDLELDERINDERNASWIGFVDWQHIETNPIDIHPRLEHGIYIKEFANNNYFMYNYQYLGCEIGYPSFNYRDIRSSYIRFQTGCFHESYPQSELDGWMANTEKELQIIQNWGYANDKIVELTTIGELAQSHDYIGIFAKNGAVFVLDDEDVEEDGTITIYTEIINDFHYYKGEVTGIHPDTKCIAWRNRENIVEPMQLKEVCNLTQDELEFLLTPLK